MSVEAPPDPVSDQMADGSLGASRRVDWRFLTGEPFPSVVVTAGRPERALLAGLSVVAGSVRHGGADGIAAPLTVVAGAIDDDGVRRAIDRVPPGGWLAVETGGALRRVRRATRGGSPPSTTAVAGRMRDVGYDDVSIHLAVPRRSAPTAFVSLTGRGSLAAWLERGRTSGKARIARLVRLTIPEGARGRVLAAVAPDALVVGRRPPGETPATRPSDWLRSRLAEVPANELGDIDPATADILLLTPRFHASGHVVALVVARDGGGWRPTLVIKAARLAAGRSTLGPELAALRDLGPTLGASGRAPRVVAADVEGSPPWLIETALVGRPLDAATVRRDRSGATDAVAAFVRALPVRRDAGDAPGRLALEGLARLDAAGVAADLVARTRALAAGLDEDMPAVVEHGDLAHPNLLLRPDGSLAAVDWERAQPAGWPLHDLTVALGYIAAAAAGASSPSDQAAAVRRALIGDDAWATPHIEAELARLAIDRRAGLALMTIAWMRTAAFLAGRAGGDWLEGDRSIALWRTTLELAERGPETST